MGKVFYLNSSELIVDFQNDDDIKQTLCCPLSTNLQECFIHLGKPRIFSGYEDRTASNRSLLEYGWTGRGSGIAIPFYCEAHTAGFIEEIDEYPFFFCMAFHKGKVNYWVYMRNICEKCQ